MHCRRLACLHVTLALGAAALLDAGHEAVLQQRLPQVCQHLVMLLRSTQGSHAQLSERAHCMHRAAGEDSTLVQMLPWQCCSREGNQLVACLCSEEAAASCCRLCVPHLERFPEALAIQVNEALQADQVDIQGLHPFPASSQDIISRATPSPMPADVQPAPAPLDAARAAATELVQPAAGLPWCQDIQFLQIIDPDASVRRTPAPRACSAPARRPAAARRRRWWPPPGCPPASWTA